MIEVAVRDRFGICPRCGKPLKLLVDTREIYGLYPSGLVHNRLGAKVVKVAVCSCGFNMKMKDSIDGLVPEDIRNPKTPDYKIDKVNLIGEIKDET